VSPSAGATRVEFRAGSLSADPIRLEPTRLKSVTRS
jgi:hypothetical protein